MDLTKDYKVLFIDLIKPENSFYIGSSENTAEILKDFYYSSKYTSVPYKEYLVRYTKLLLVDEDGNVEEIIYQT